MSQNEEILPRPSGKYSVGYIDFEILKPQSPFQSGKAEGVLVRLYYPTDQDFSLEKRSDWIPSSEYFPGYGYYLRIPSLLFTPISRIFLGGVKLWAMENAPPLMVHSCPLVIFSHGLGGIRTTYSTMCCEMASQGYAVAAIEHRDGSASMTLLSDNQVRTYEVIEKNSPGEFEKRHRQLRYRTEEVELVYDFLKNWGEREEPELIVREPSGEILDNLKTTIKPDSLIVMGHSFGAATAINFALKNPQIPSLSITALDPWMFAIPKPPSDPLPILSKINLIVIDMEDFQFTENLLSIKLHLEYFQSSEFYTVVRGDHKQCSDIPLFKLGSLLSLNNKNPKTPNVLRCLNRVILSFLRDGIGIVPPDILKLFDGLLFKNNL
jgi:platelet-activating factor acetylhydrolase